MKWEYVPDSCIGERNPLCRQDKNLKDLLVRSCLKLVDRTFLLSNVVVIEDAILVCLFLRQARFSFQSPCYQFRKVLPIFLTNSFVPLCAIWSIQAYRGDWLMLRRSGSPISEWYFQDSTDTGCQELLSKKHPRKTWNFRHGNQLLFFGWIISESSVKVPYFLSWVFPLNQN